VNLALTNPDLAKKTIGRTMRLADPEAIEEVYQRVTMVMSDSRSSQGGHRYDSQTFACDVQSQPYRVLDMSVLERIEKEGFVRSLYPAK
jgi:hypothetical protein